MNSDYYPGITKQDNALQEKKCVGGKFSKQRLTRQAACNTLSQKLPMFIIGEVNKPRCFKNLKSLSCRYRGQRKSWMDGDLLKIGFVNRIKSLRAKTAKYC